MNGKKTALSGQADFGLGPDATQAFLSSFVPPSDVIKTLPEQLADKLVENIVRGVCKPGQRLHEVSLAEKFSVSRGPVREALRILEREGLVSMPPRKGASVMTLTPQRVRDIFGVRAALLAICSEDLARRRPHAAVAALKEGTKALTEALDTRAADEYIVLVYQLSMYLADMANNKLARDILFSLGRQTLSLTRVALQDYHQRHNWTANWTGITQGIVDGDPVRAGHATIHLVDTVRDAALEALERIDKTPEDEDAPPKGANIRSM